MGLLRQTSSTDITILQPLEEELTLWRLSCNRNRSAICSLWNFFASYL